MKNILIEYSCMLMKYVRNEWKIAEKKNQERCI